MAKAARRNRTRASREILPQDQTLADLKGQIAATNKSQAVCEFELDGTIITAGLGRS